MSFEDDPEIIGLRRKLFKRGPSTPAEEVVRLDTLHVPAKSDNTPTIMKVDNHKVGTSNRRYYMWYSI